MIVLIQHLWPALAIAALLGLGMAALFGAGSGLPSARRDVQLGAGLLLAAGLLLSVLQVVAGRPGLWLDIGVLCGFAYAAGVGAGSAIRWAMARSRRPANSPPAEEAV